eukprot:CAMPEP_0196640606 /NCGR_PEP_ID=MMETSP1085-20130531/2812_1 /TAXON_ID=41879 ORGANISM="Pycnococcus sp, Strain CCMP1998" /NCGR_SAMPLE_ID=MMETSP1085 /ASSEMBLY_ACC=CAM_ASM_000807 /LENGTH=192 /DNA_ID=CAMNT_0041969785 /DNA_START=251 /DNA_END=826 /DNA_ORIENTATION=+
MGCIFSTNRKKSGDKYKAVDAEAETKSAAPASSAENYGTVDKPKAEQQYAPATPPETPTNALNKALLKKVEDKSPTPKKESTPVAEEPAKKTPTPKISAGKRKSIDLQLGEELREKLEQEAPAANEGAQEAQKSAEAQKEEASAGDEDAGASEDGENLTPEEQAAAEKKKRQNKKRNQKKRARAKKKKAAAK